MEAEPELGSPVFTLTWRIENFSYCTQSYQDPLDSVSCKAECLDNTEWFLRVYPRGRNLDSFVPCFLRRVDADEGPTSISIDFEMSIIDADGTSCFARKIFDYSFPKSRGLGFPDFVKRDVLFKSKYLYIPNDVLTIQCVISLRGYSNHETTSCSMRSVIHVERRSFCKRITDFSSRHWDDILPISVPSPSNVSPELTLHFHLPRFEEFLEISLKRRVTSENSVLFVKCELSLLDSKHESREFNTFEHLYKESEENWNLPPCINRKKLSDNLDIYLQNDVLSLHFILHISTGTESKSIVQLINGHPVSISNASSSNLSYKETNGLRHDIYRLYSKQKFCDVIVRTKTRYLLAHKAVICARSSVFCDLLENDDKVKVNGIIEIADTDCNVVNIMLKFMYTDGLPDVSFDIALDLFTLAHKYHITSLKKQCIVKLKDLISIENICDLLLLCDSNQDPSIMKLANDFICANSDTILRLEKWKRFMLNHTQLASDVMLYICLNK